jgi:MFS family permease
MDTTRRLDSEENSNLAKLTFKITLCLLSVYVLTSLVSNFFWGHLLTITDMKSTLINGQDMTTILFNRDYDLTTIPIYALMLAAFVNIYKEIKRRPEDFVFCGDPEKVMVFGFVFGIFLALLFWLSYIELDTLFMAAAAGGMCAGLASMLVGSMTPEVMGEQTKAADLAMIWLGGPLHMIGFCLLMGLKIGMLNGLMLFMFSVMTSLITFTIFGVWMWGVLSAGRLLVRGAIRIYTAGRAVIA